MCILHLKDFLNKNRFSQTQKEKINILLTYLTRLVCLPTLLKIKFAISATIRTPINQLKNGKVPIKKSIT